MNMLKVDACNHSHLEPTQYPSQEPTKAFEQAVDEGTTAVVDVQDGNFDETTNESGRVLETVPMWMLIAGAALISCCISTLILMLLMLRKRKKEQKRNEDHVAAGSVATNPQLPSYPSYEESRRAQDHNPVNLHYDATSLRNNGSPQAMQVPNSQQNDLVSGMNVANQNIKSYRDSIFDAEMDVIDNDVDEHQNYQSESFDESTGSD